MDRGCSGLVGLFLLTIEDSLVMGRGDLLVLIGAFFWALHVIWIGHLAKRANPVHIACIQFVICSILCTVTALCAEAISAQAVRQAAIPILYGGLLSAGVAFTLQIVSQRHCPPAHAAIILSSETVFAALAGWIVLGETLTVRGLLGCALMLASLMVVQLPAILSSKVLRFGAESRQDSNAFPIEHPFGQ